jgi:hypothetical protein
MTRRKATESQLWKFKEGDTVETTEKYDKFFKGYYKGKVVNMSDYEDWDGTWVTFLSEDTNEMMSVSETYLRPHNKENPKEYRNGKIITTSTIEDIMLNQKTQEEQN